MVSLRRAAAAVLASTHRSKCARILQLLDDSPDLGASIFDRAVFELPYSVARVLVRCQLSAGRRE